MKKALKVVGIILAALAVLVLVAVGVLVTRKPAFKPASPEKIEATAQRLERGKYLVEHVSMCVDCHSQQDMSKFPAPVIAGSELGGGHCIGKEEGFPGSVCTPNITPDQTGLADWTDGEILRAIREGVDKHDKALFPMMPYNYLRAMSDEDARAVVAYLRQVKPMKHPVQPSDIPFPMGAMIVGVPEPLAGPVADPDPNDHVAHGKYLTQVALCVMCHTKHTDGDGVPFAGGEQFTVPGFGRAVSANLTPDDTGIGKWSKEQFVGMFKAYASAAPAPAQKGRATVMPWLSFSGMTEGDLGDIYDYLKTVAPVKNQVNRFPDAAP